MSEENVSKHISKAFSSEGARPKYKTPNISNITEKLRAENKLFSENNRLRVVNCFRALSEADTTEDGSSVASGSSRNLTIVDIESHPATSVTSDKTLEDATKKYVYDLYYAPDCDLDDKILGNPMSCHPLDDLVYEDYCDDVYVNDEVSDDSNDESNWRNDYPDEDPDSIGEEDMKLVCSVGGLDLGEANSLSSDAGEEDLVYGVDEEPDCTLGVDEEYFGSTYAAYKKRVTNHLDPDASESSDSFNSPSSDDSDNDICS